MDYNYLAELLFPDVTETPEDMEKRFPKRELPEGAVVSRMAPSPTGFLHVGSLFAAFVSQRAAKATDGVFYLRVEDTDKKREVENGVTGIVEGLNDFGIVPDEGMINETESTGAYAPYIQSRRTHIYQAYVKQLVQQGMAYPCFMTEEEAAEIREKQEHDKELPGIYGKYAKYRDITVDEAKKLMAEGREYVLRLKSPGKPDGKVSFKDAVKGNIEMPENILDVVLLKKDGTPTYHFAHAVDDLCAAAPAAFKDACQTCIDDGGGAARLTNDCIFSHDDFSFFVFSVLAILKCAGAQKQTRGKGR